MQDRLTGRTLVIATGHALSLALLEGGEVLAETNSVMQRGHAEALMPEIVNLLAPFGGPDAKCNRIVVEVGPGSFTGLRVGIAAAKALALVWDCDILGVRSTQLVAAEARMRGLQGPLAVALAAPRGQIWFERFKADGLESLGPPLALGSDDLARNIDAGDCMIGSAGPVREGCGMEGYPKAAALAGVAESDLMRAEPLYVRVGEMESSSGKM